MVVELLGTSGCHLCEIAERLVRRMVPAMGGEVEYLDIATDDALVDEYGIKIPVLRRKGQKSAELNWPFDEESLLNWLKAK